MVMRMDFLGKVGNIMFESITKATDAYLFAMEGSSNITRWSLNAVEDFELPGEYVTDTASLWEQLIHPEDIEAFLEDWDSINRGEKDYHHCVYRIRKRDGKYIWVRCRGQVTRDENGGIAWFVGVVCEISGKNIMDYTTKLFNIYEFRNALTSMIEKGSCNGGVLLFGVDSFHKINTMYSYSFGDRVLMSLAERLQEITPPGVKLYRIEGDKFACICPRYTGTEMAKLFHVIASAVSGLEIAKGETLKLSVSAGAIMLSALYRDADDIFKNLQHALSVSKRGTEGTMTFFSETLLEESLRHIRLREELRRCVDNHYEGFELYFQPIMSGDGSRLHSCEALLRWNNDKFPNTYPDKFIPILEESGLIVKVGGWAGREALFCLKEWRKYIPDLCMNINLSYVQIKVPRVLQNILQGLAALKLPPESLVIEITESCELEERQAVVDFVDTLRSKGVQVALDDFGTGYSSVRILQQVSTDWVKLDHKFVSKISDNEYDRTIVKYLIGLCHSLGYKVCVEGVEDPACFELVRNENVEAIQGYYYSRPIPAQEFAAKYIRDKIGKN